MMTRLNLFLWDCRRICWIFCTQEDDEDGIDGMHRTTAQAEDAEDAAAITAVASSSKDSGISRSSRLTKPLYLSVNSTSILTTSAATHAAHREFPAREFPALTPVLGTNYLPLTQTVWCDIENKRLDCRSWMAWYHVNYPRICLG